MARNLRQAVRDAYQAMIDEEAAEEAAKQARIELGRELAEIVKGKFKEWLLTTHDIDARNNQIEVVVQYLESSHEPTPEEPMYFEVALLVLPGNYSSRISQAWITMTGRNEEIHFESSSWYLEVTGYPTLERALAAFFPVLRSLGDEEGQPAGGKGKADV